MKKTPKTKGLKTKIITGLATLSVITGIGVNSAFDSAEEILLSDVQEPTPIVRTYEPEPPVAETAAVPAEETAAETGSAFKNWILRLPVAVRAVTVLPLYGIGAGITHLLGAFFSGIMAPALASVLKWIVFAAAILAAIAGVLKLIFPDMPLKKILRPKNLLWALLGVAIIQILDKTLPLAFPNYESFANALKYTLGLCVVIMVFVPIVTSSLKKKSEPQKLKMPYS